jgi:hypothetical protein
LFHFADEMADHATDILRMLGDNTKGKKKGKASKKGSVLATSAAGGSDSGSPKLDSPGLKDTSRRPEKRPRSSPEVEVLDIAARRGEQSVIPQCWATRSYFDKYPLAVAAKEKSIIKEMGPEQREGCMKDDIAGLMRLVSTVLVLNEESKEPGKEIEKLKARIETLKASKLKLEVTVDDLQNKKEVWLRTQTELRAATESLEAASKKQKELEDELAKLKASTAPVENEPEYARGLTTRAALVEELTSVRGKITAAAKLGFGNAVAQLKIVNPELVTAGTGFWRRVVDREVVLPPENEVAEADELLNNEEEEDGEDDDMEHDHSDGEDEAKEDEPATVEHVEAEPHGEESRDEGN